MRTLSIQKALLLFGAVVFAQLGWSQCTDLFISQYQEGSGQNKVLEIYNPTEAAIALDDYEITKCGNGCEVEGEWEEAFAFTAGAMIDAGGTYVVCHETADAAITAFADQFILLNHNGDDALGLRKISSGETLDQVGTLSAEDVGSSWPVGNGNLTDGATANNTLVRIASVQMGTTDWAVGATQWMVFESNSVENLGMHTMTACGPGVENEVGFATAAMTVGEDAGVVTVAINGGNVVTDMEIFVGSTGSASATEGDFSGDIPASVMITMAADMASFDITIIDDMVVEGDEELVFTLTDATGTAVFTNATFTLTIADNDFDVSPIADIHMENADGTAASLGEEFLIRGVVYGVNLGSEIQFYFLDQTGGIFVRNTSSNLGYETVAEGDSLEIQGTVGQFNGFTQFAPSVITMLGTSPIVDPTEVTELNEDTESQLVVLNCVTLADPTEWNDSGSSFNFEVTDGVNTYPVRIDSDTDVAGTAAPTGNFNLIGMGGQFDGSAPHDSGYQLFPRSLTDFVASEDCGDLTCQGGIVEAVDGSTMVEICSAVDFQSVTFEASFSTPASQALVVTDEMNFIVAISTELTIDFSTYMDGTYRVWNLVWDGDLDATTTDVGDDATMVMTSGDCLSLSTNFVTVSKIDCGACAATGITTADGADAFAICVGDSLNDVFTTVGVGDNQALLVVSMGTILDAFVGTTATSEVFAAEDAGDYQIHTYYYNGEMIDWTMFIGTLVADFNPAVDCGALSTAFVALTVETCSNLPFYTIGELNNLNADGEPDSLGLAVMTGGIVHGVNMRGGGSQFTIIDNTGGIGTFSDAESFGYTVTEGDSVTVEGTVAFFNGLTQITMTGITFQSAGNALYGPAVVTELGEAQESALVTLNCVSIIDPADWSDSGSFNVEVTDGTNNFFLRIDSDTDVSGTAAPVGAFSVTGIGGQFDNAAPYDDGYQLFPRYMADIVETAAPAEIVVPVAADEVDEIVPGSYSIWNQFAIDLTFEGNIPEGGTNPTWVFDYTDGDEFDETAMGDDFVLTLNPEWFSLGTLTLTYTSAEGCLVSTTISMTFGWMGVEEVEASISAYPNPVNNTLNIQSTQAIDSACIYDMQGRLVINEAANGAALMQLNTARLSAGMYTLQVQIGTQMLTKLIEKK